jgi:transcriptional regulator with XRE-family HTH domain
MRRVSAISPPKDPLVKTSAELGAAIRAARCAARMSIADAAMQLGVAKQTLSNLETAKGSVGIDTALRAANEFGVSLFAVPATERELVRRAIQGIRANAPTSPGLNESPSSAKPRPDPRRPRT